MSPTPCLSSRSPSERQLRLSCKTTRSHGYKRVFTSAVKYTTGAPYALVHLCWALAAKHVPSQDVPRSMKTTVLRVLGRHLLREPGASDARHGRLRHLPRLHLNAYLRCSRGAASTAFGYVGTQGPPQRYLRQSSPAIARCIYSQIK